MPRQVARDNQTRTPREDEQHAPVEQAAKVAAGYIRDPMQVLHKKRITQAEFHHLMGPLRLAELGVALGGRGWRPEGGPGESAAPCTR